MEITVRVPDALARKLERYQSRLPELLERGLRDIAVEGAQEFQDESAVLEVLAGQPSLEQVLALQPSPGLQARVSDLLVRSKHHQIAPHEEAELDRYLVVEHLVRVAKAHAYKVLAARQ